MVSPIYPSNPNIGDTYNVGNITFRWDGEKWKSIAPANHENRIASLELRDNVEATSTELDDISADINTSGKSQFKQVGNTTTNRLMYASGSSANDVWLYMDGSTAHTPT